MNVRKGYADTRAGQVHYRRVDGGGTPVVFLHQTASSGAMWLKVMAALGNGRPLYALDTPGFGGSFDPPDPAPSIADFAGWIGDALDALGLPAAHVVGHHTGACIGVELAALRPARVRSLALIGPVPLTAEERQQFSTLFGAPFVPVASGSYLVDVWEYLRSAGGGVDLAVLNREVSDTLRAYPTRSKAYAAVWSHDFTARFRTLRCPLQLICAPDDVLFPYFERARTLRPDADARLLARGANFEPDIAPDEVAACLADHFAAVERTPPAGDAG